MKQTFPVETSARHVHITAEHLKVLFGEDAVLHPRKELSQPGQYACEEQVTVAGPKGEIRGVSILGPERSATQVELSLTDGRTLGIRLPVRESGDLAGSASCRLIGPCGELELAEGVIAARRHVHMSPADAERFGVRDREVVAVKLDTPERSLIFGDVLIRVGKDYLTSMHIDTDEANAAGCCGETRGSIFRLRENG